MTIIQGPQGPNPNTQTPSTESRSKALSCALDAIKAFGRGVAAFFCNIGHFFQARIFVKKTPEPVPESMPETKPPHISLMLQDPEKHRDMLIEYFLHTNFGATFQEFRKKTPKGAVESQFTRQFFSFLITDKRSKDTISEIYAFYSKSAVYRNAAKYPQYASAQAMAEGIVDAMIASKKASS